MVVAHCKIQIDLAISTQWEFLIFVSLPFCLTERLFGAQLRTQNDNIIHVV
jgi:hypothetical protein